MQKESFPEKFLVLFSGANILYSRYLKPPNEFLAPPRLLFKNMVKNANAFKERSEHQRDFHPLDVVQNHCDDGAEPLDNKGFVRFLLLFFKLIAFLSSAEHKR